MSIENKRPGSVRDWNAYGREHSASSQPQVARKYVRRNRRWYRAAKILLLLLVFAILLMAVRENVWQPKQIARAPRVQHVATFQRRVGSFVALPLSTRQVDTLENMGHLFSYKRLAQLYVSHMTLNEKLGQLFMAEYYDTSYSPALDTMVSRLHAGGVVMYAFQMKTFAQTKYDIDEMQNHAKIPLFISADEEGGFVERIQNIYGHRPGALQTYQTGNPGNASQLGRSIAHDLLALGINEDLAPDVDVQLVNGPDQYLRTWGYTPQSVITYAGAYMRAVQRAGVIACIKHFPGLGAAQTDAHFDLPIVNRTRQQISSVELAPFKAFIRSHNPLEQPGMVMPTDVSMPAIDPVWPAELSHTFITNILRKQLGYNGVVITDALYMKGISNHWSLPQAAVLALNAGNDMILGANGPAQMQDMLNGLKTALRDGQLAQARVDEAVTRIILLKLERKLVNSSSSS
ncbi:MAG TPA: glycoside hydrolase family 3 N-terminal domain-containing protein [Ktedonobacteraceae bacterium]